MSGMRSTVASVLLALMFASDISAGQAPPPAGQSQPQGQSQAATANRRRRPSPSILRR